jgi:TolB-like protein
MYRFGGYTLDPDRGRLVRPDSTEAALRPKSAEVLRHLADNAGQVVTRDALMAAVWPDVFVTDDSITQCVADIRRALGGDAPGLVRTLPRRGYLLDTTVTCGTPSSPAQPEPSAEESPAPPRAAVAEARPSIAVLPFRLSPADAEDGYFADGFVDDIVVSLSGLKDLFVIQRGSTLNLGRAGNADPLAVGRQLGVRYVLHGGVQRGGGRIRVRTELTDVETGTVVGGGRYDTALDALFDLQDRISTSLVRTIAPSVREHELRRALRKHPRNMTAYDLVLQALDRLYRMDDDSFACARRLLGQAMELDPDYASPHIWAALWHVFRVGEMGAPDPAAEAEAAAHHAAAAVARNPSDPLALAVHGHVRSFLMRDYATARHFLDRAIDAGPSTAVAWTMSAATHGYVGDGRSAVAQAERGLSLSPADPFLFWHEGILANAHYVAGDFERAAAWARSAVAQNPSIRFTHRTLVASLAAAGRTAEARRVAGQLLRLQPGFRLSAYARLCPFVPGVIEGWIGHLRLAELPE